MQPYNASLTTYKRLPTREVMVGDLAIGNFHPIRVQTMTTTDTMDTAATVAQVIRCIEAGSELVRITAPSKKEAENLLPIKNELRRRGYNTPLVADIHFTPNAAEIAARIVEKVRINPGNYIDKKKFEHIEYTDAEYQNEMDRIRERFTPLVKICKEYGTALRIGTNHGSLSDRIMSRYGDTPTGMVESALEFLRIAEDLDFFNIILSMKSSNPLVMVQAYRLLIVKMAEEQMHYPLHLGVTEAGDGEDGRIKSSIGIGTLLEDGIGDTIRVSLTEDPEQEIPVCQALVKRYALPELQTPSLPPIIRIPFSPFAYSRRHSFELQGIGGKQVPVVIADLSRATKIGLQELVGLGYLFNEAACKWEKSDMAADFVYAGDLDLPQNFPEDLKVIRDAGVGASGSDNFSGYPLFDTNSYLSRERRSESLNFVQVRAEDLSGDHLLPFLSAIEHDLSVVLILKSDHPHAMMAMRRFCCELMGRKLEHPVILRVRANQPTAEDALIQFAVETGALLLDGMGDGLLLDDDPVNPQFSLRALLQIAFGILQATRTRISKTDYISCPSCGRTQFELMETTARIRAVTHHLKGVKIAIMGCIVNGPGEMADADFGYVGSGLGKITLYKGKEVVKRNLNPEVAVDELIRLIQENGRWATV